LGNKSARTLSKITGSKFEKADLNSDENKKADFIAACLLRLPEWAESEPPNGGFEVSEEFKGSQKKPRVNKLMA
jgi:hypothetical protein